jgi:hypothetical protein
MATPADEITVTEAIQQLRALGYGADFSVAPGGLVRCHVCGTEHDPATLTVREVLRVEGMSDPDDEAAVFGLVCGRCGTRGVLVVPYGPAASADEAAVLTHLANP